MVGEVSKDFYCSSENGRSDGFCLLRGKCPLVMGKCDLLHRKWPTPKQFKKEYGQKYPDNGAVYFRTVKYFTDSQRKVAKDYYKWVVCLYSAAKEDGIKKNDYKEFTQIICACTPWGKPPDDWRPE